MSERGRSISPRPLNDNDIEMDNNELAQEKPHAKVVVVTNLTRNVVEAHLRVIFGFYGELQRVDLPVFGKSGQNRGRAALEYSTPSAAQKAAQHMDGGQLDGAVLKVELSDEPLRSRSRSQRRYGRTNTRGVHRSNSVSRSRSRTSARRQATYERDRERRFSDAYRSRGQNRRPAPGRNTYRPSRSRSRSRSPVRRRDGLGPRRASPTYERPIYRGRSRSRSYTPYSSRSRNRSYSSSRSRSSRSRSYSSYSRYSRSPSKSIGRSRSRSRSMSYSRERSFSRDDIRDSRSRSP